MKKNNRTPLQGIRVLDFTHNLPGPYATMLLAALGAEVIKVEPPGGDVARGIGQLFNLVNGGKKSVVVDLKSSAGREDLERLIGTADVLVEGFRPGVMAKLGFSADRCLERCPRLIYCSISGFGQTGPYAAYPGHDLNYQALTGVCDMERGDGDGAPRGTALPIADLSASFVAAASILAALFGRERDGKGTVLDVAMTDAVLSWVHVWNEGLSPKPARLSAALPMAQRWIEHAGEKLPAGLAALAGTLAAALSSEHASNLADRLGAYAKSSGLLARLERLHLYVLPHYNIYRTRDGKYLSLAIVDEDHFWRSFSRDMGFGAHIGSLPLPARFLLASPLRALVERAIRRHTLQELMGRLKLTEIPVMPVLTLEQARRDAQLRSRPVALGGVIGSPLAIGEQIRAAAPRLGQHTEEILGALRP
ncbi:MAG: CoA transferase [Candidatus Schekmanbacteria bacterium]|nr:CoA transferase [Candidatus Schekmanbacteria bacterium]